MQLKMDTTTDDPVYQGVNSSGVDHDSRIVGPEGYPLFVLMLLEGVLILLGNTLTVLAIVTTPDLNTQANSYILHLAIADGIVGVAALWWSFNYVDFSRRFFDHRKYLCICCYVLTMISVIQSLLTLTLMAVDRLLYVQHPYFHVRSFTERLTKRIAACTWVFSLAYGASIPLLHEDFNPDIGCVVSEILDSHVDIAKLVPILIMMFATSACYIRIACIARHQRNRINAEGRASHQEGARSSSGSTAGRSRVDGLKSTGLFLTINCLFVLSWAPNVVYILVGGSDRVVGFVTFVAMSNSGMNFVIYAWKNRQFARAYKRLLTRCVRQ